MQALNRNRRWPIRLVLSTLAVIFSSMPGAQTPDPFPVPLVKENTTVKISEHVYVIPDGNVPVVPNVGIIVGTKATLVVDPGLGTRNGEVVLRELAKVSKNTELYVASTHYHPEHTTGGVAFAARAKFIRPRVQQKEMEEFGAAAFENFRKRTPEFAELMQGSTYPRADILFEREQTLDLGGVHVRLSLLGPAHTQGDTAIFVEEDKVLFSGDLAMKRLFPAFSTPSASGQVWLASLDRLDALRPMKVVGSHGELGDASLISEYRNYLKAVQARVGELKGQGKSLDEVARLLTAEFQSKYPGWAYPVRIAVAAKVFYAEM
jgi:glyoxylase-like metal-dependent hydrolase (beta-lactamase superfamily II)